MGRDFLFKNQSTLSIVQQLIMLRTLKECQNNTRFSWQIKSFPVTVSIFCLQVQNTVIWKLILSIVFAFFTEKIWASWLSLSEKTKIKQKQKHPQKPQTNPNPWKTKLKKKKPKKKTYHQNQKKTTPKHTTAKQTLSNSELLISLFPALYISTTELLSCLDISALFLIKIRDILKYEILYSI